MTRWRNRRKLSGMVDFGAYAERTPPGKPDCVILPGGYALTRRRGRPVKLRPCKVCGAAFGCDAMRLHLPLCRARLRLEKHDSLYSADSSVIVRQNCYPSEVPTSTPQV